MADEKQERAEGVSRMLTGEDAPEDTNVESLTRPPSVVSSSRTVLKVAGAERSKA